MSKEDEVKYQVLKVEHREIDTICNNLQASQKRLQNDHDELMRQAKAREDEKEAIKNELPEIAKEYNKSQAKQKILRTILDEMVNESNELKAREKTLNSRLVEIAEESKEGQAKQKTLENVLEVFENEAKDKKAIHTSSRCKLEKVIQKTDENVAKKKSIQNKIEELELKSKNNETEEKMILSSLEELKKEYKGLKAHQQELMKESCTLQAKQCAAEQKVQCLQLEQQLHAVQESLGCEMALLSKKKEKNQSSGFCMNSFALSLDKAIDGIFQEQQSSGDPQGRDDGESNVQREHEQKLRDVALAPKQVKEAKTNKKDEKNNSLLQLLDDAIDGMFEGVGLNPVCSPIQK